MIRVSGCAFIYFLKLLRSVSREGHIRAKQNKTKQTEQQQKRKEKRKEKEKKKPTTNKTGCQTTSRQQSD